MSTTVSWILVLLGPFVLVVVPQWFGRRGLARKGLPESLKPARTTLRGLLLDSCISVSHRVDGERDIPLRDMVGDDLPEEKREHNQQRLHAYQRFLDGKLMLPLIYKIEPGIILGFIYAIVNIIAAPGSGQVGTSDITIIRTAGGIVVTIACATVCVAVALAYLRVLDILAEVGETETAASSNQLIGVR